MNDLDAVIAAQKAWEHARSGDGARAAAESAFAIAADALARLRANLRAIGFDVKDPAPIPDLDANIAKLETALGFAPPEILQVMWRKVGEASVVDLDEYAHRRFWNDHAVRGARGATDGVLLYGCGASWVEWMASSIEDFIADDQDPKYFLLELSPDGFHKDDISGGSSYGINAVAAYSAPLENFAWMGERPKSAPESEVDVLSYLRVAVLECAGFPGLHGTPAFEPFRRRLLEGLPVF